MKEYIIDYEGGNFLREVFYQLVVENDDQLTDMEASAKTKPDPWIIVRRYAERPGFERGLVPWLDDITCSTKVYGECPLDPNHYTKELKTNYEPGIVHYNLDYGDFIPGFMEEIYVSLKFKLRLEQQKFKGALFEKVECALYNDPTRSHTFYHPQGAGKILQNWPLVFNDGKNECPYCGKGPLFCPACGACSGSTCENRLSPSTCKYCQKMIHYDLDKPEQHQGAKCTNFNINYGPLLHGKSWDGQDFVQYYGFLLISRRVLDFLLQEKAAPFCAIPCRFFTDGMTDKQMEQLKVVTNGRLK